MAQAPQEPGRGEERRPLTLRTAGQGTQSAADAENGKWFKREAATIPCVLTFSSMPSTTLKTKTGGLGVSPASSHSVKSITQYSL